MMLKRVLMTQIKDLDMDLMILMKTTNYVNKLWNISPFQMRKSIHFKQK